MVNCPLKFDLHVHTPFSDGQRDLDLVIPALIRQGVQVVGFADHIFPGVRCFSRKVLAYRKGVIQRYYQRKYPQIRMLVGGEIDLWPNGALTLPPGVGEDDFDYLMAAHHHTLPKQMDVLFKRNQKGERWLWKHAPYLRLNTHMWKLATYEAFRRYKVDVLAHPHVGLPRYMEDAEYKQFVLQCKKYGVAIELNQIPVWGGPLRGERPYLLRNFVKKFHRREEIILDYGKKYHVKFSIGSDFHGFKRDWEQRDLADYLDTMYYLAEQWDVDLLDPSKFFPENRATHVHAR